MPVFSDFFLLESEENSFAGSAMTSGKACVLGTWSTIQSNIVESLSVEARTTWSPFVKSACRLRFSSFFSFAVNNAVEGGLQWEMAVVFAFADGLELSFSDPRPQPPTNRVHSPMYQASDLLRVDGRGLVPGSSTLVGSGADPRPRAGMAGRSTPNSRPRAPRISQSRRQ